MCGHGAARRALAWLAARDMARRCNTLLSELLLACPSSMNYGSRIGAGHVSAPGDTASLSVIQPGPEIATGYTCR